jgi:hypothetical protein
MTDNRGPNLEGVADLFMATAIITVSLRSYVRAVMLRSLSFDDWLAVATLVKIAIKTHCQLAVLTWAEDIFHHFLRLRASGRQVRGWTSPTRCSKGEPIQNTEGKLLPPVSQNIRCTPINKAIQCRWFGEFFYIITSVLVKYTVGIFLLRIISTRWQRVLIWTVLGVILVFNVFYLFIVVFQCSPPNYFWNRFLDPGTGHCLPKPFISNTAYVGSAINAWADWMLGLLPVYVVWKLNLKLRDKVLLAGVLALGSM